MSRLWQNEVVHVDPGAEADGATHLDLGLVELDVLDAVAPEDVERRVVR